MSEKNFITPLLIKIKRYYKIANKPYVRTKFNTDISLYSGDEPDEDDIPEEAAVNMNFDGDVTLKVLDILLVCTTAVAGLVLIGKICSAFRRH